jgi:hypothetical protein
MPNSQHSPQSRTPTLYLHIGAPKTGTSYLQLLMWRNRERLAEDGVLRPGRAEEKHFGYTHDHFGAAKDLATGRSAKRRANRPGGWQSLVAEVRNWPGVSVISAENLASAKPDRVARAREGLDGVELHIVYSARDLARQIPSVWQERLKNREVVSYADYVGGVMSPKSGHPSGAKFWHAQDAVDVLRRWSIDIPPERVHVVTVPQTGSKGDTLWDRFASVLGVDPTHYDTELPSANTSLGAAEARVLLQLNSSLDKRFSHGNYGSLVKQLVAKEVLAERSRGGLKIELMPEHWDATLARSEQLVHGLREAGYHVVGDLDDLIPQLRPDGAPAHPDKIDPQLVADAAIAGLSGVLQRLAAATHNPPRKPHSPALRRHLGPAMGGRKRRRTASSAGRQGKSLWSRLRG